MDPDFVYAIMRQESAFNPGAVSSADARGIMQMMPFLAKAIASQWDYGPYYNDKMLFYAYESLKLSIFHLQQLKTMAPHLALVAAGYNAGIVRVMSWWRRVYPLPTDVFIEMIPILETRNYVKLVLRNFFQYKTLKSGGKIDLNHLFANVPLELPMVVPWGPAHSLM